MAGEAGPAGWQQGAGEVVPAWWQQVMWLLLQSFIPHCFLSNYCVRIIRDLSMPALDGPDWLGMDRTGRWPGPACRRMWLISMTGGMEESVGQEKECVCGFREGSSYRGLPGEGLC